MALQRPHPYIIPMQPSAVPVPNGLPSVVSVVHLPSPLYITDRCFLFSFMILLASPFTPVQLFLFGRCLLSSGGCHLLFPSPSSNLYFKPCGRNLEELLYSPVSNHTVCVFSIWSSVLIDVPVCIYCCTLEELSISITTAMSQVVCKNSSIDKLLEEELESLKIVFSRLVSFSK